MLFTQQQIKRVRDQALQMDRDGQVTDEVLQLIYDYRLFHLFVPDELEGRMTPLPEAVRIFQECSRIDGNLGWLVTIGAGGGFFASFMTPEVSRNVYAHRTAVIAGSGMPSGTARRVPGGYRVEGSWKYCSGSTHATAFTANAMILPEDEALVSESEENPSIRSFILMPDQIHIDSDWNAFGLKATSSHRITAKDVFVPEEMTFDITDQKAYGHELIYAYPFLPFAQASFAAVTLGIAEHFLEEAEALLMQKPSHPHVTSQFIKLQETLRDSENAFHSCISQSWSVLLEEGQLSPEVESNVSALCISTAQISLQCGQEMFPLLGLSAAMENSAVNRTWRDLQTSCQHALLRSY